MKLSLRLIVYMAGHRMNQVFFNEAFEFRGTRVTSQCLDGAAVDCRQQENTAI